MPETEDERLKREAREERVRLAERTYGTAPTTAPAQTQMKSGDLGFMESFSRPGYGNNWGADLAKILTQGAAGAMGGGLPGAAASFGQIALDPESLRAGSGIGNIAEGVLGRGNILAKKIPAIANLFQKAPSLMGAATGGLEGAGIGAAGAVDTGGDPEESGALSGIFGAMAGGAGGFLHKKLNQLPSPLAGRIDDSLAKFSDPPPDANQRTRQASSLLSLLAKSPEEAKQAQIAERGGREASLQNLLLEASGKKQRPHVKGALTTAARDQGLFEQMKATQRAQTPATLPLTLEAATARDSKLAAKRATSKLGGIEGAANAADTQVTKLKAQQTIAEGNFQDIYTKAKIDPATLTENSRRFVQVLGKDADTVTLKEAVEKAVKDPQHAEGLRDLLEQSHPDTLNSVRANLVHDIFQTSRTGRGGTNYPKVYSGKELVNKLNNFDDAGFNTLFGYDGALADLKEIAEAAVDADSLAKKKNFMSLGNLAMTGGGATAFYAMGKHTTDPAAAATLILGGAAGHFAFNVPNYVESLIEGNSYLGRIVSTYLKSPNPDKLPKELTKIVSRFMVPLENPEGVEKPGYNPKSRQLEKVK